MEHFAEFYNKVAHFVKRPMGGSQTLSSATAYLAQLNSWISFMMFSLTFQAPTYRLPHRFHLFQVSIRGNYRKRYV
jgi:hypothetical protein